MRKCTVTFQQASEFNACLTRKLLPEKVSYNIFENIRYCCVISTAFCAGNQEGQYRLINSSSPYNGILEVCMDGSWKPVCSNKEQDEVLLIQVEIICSELGFSHGINNFNLD